ncbi:rRNA pseudouridine synthase [Streptococcus thermophilus]|uniref:pseudouridine synthase n=1 Tax=Streptococcus thermophilus TaxID=1308 RepID=UPI001A99D863|nr:pseudouridine synthase [Streptococcus thermophilus]MBO1162292.1 rRNA pseudouridine synthase [Streptococcus thermophilus]
MRINKYIAHAGVASRRKAEELIKEGRVTLNGKTVMELATIVKNGDIVEVNGSPIYNEEKVYYLLNKPRGVISSVSDEKNRKTVIDLMPHVKERIYPVGRLDWDTTGLLILTNDGDFDGKKTQPAHYNIIKVDHEKNRSVVELTIHEGRNHQVKKMFESVGLIVDKLSRTRFGTLDLTGLRPGESRRLSKKEISQLHNIAVNKVK